MARRLIGAGLAGSGAAGNDKDSARRAVNTAMLLDEITRLTYVRAGDELGLRPAHWSALRYLASTQDSARTAAAFARHFGLDRSGVNRLFQHLEQLGFVRRDERGNGADQRQRRLMLTEAGWEAMDHDPIGMLADVMRKDLTDGQLRAFAATAWAIAQGIGGRSSVLTTHRARTLLAEPAAPEPRQSPAARRTPSAGAEDRALERARQGAGYRTLVKEFALSEPRARAIARQARGC